jgi:hypothetical protein
MIYFNQKNQNGIETINQLNSKDFSSKSDYKKECFRLLQEYKGQGINAYLSQRACKNWIEE